MENSCSVVVQCKKIVPRNVGSHHRNCTTLDLSEVKRELVSVGQIKDALYVRCIEAVKVNSSTSQLLRFLQIVERASQSS